MKKEHSKNIKEMFNRISRGYVLMNRVMTFGWDKHWRRELIKFAELKDGVRLLDVATGTGDVIMEVISSGVKLNRTAGVDFSVGMLSIARSRLSVCSGNTPDSQPDNQPYNQPVELIEGDALKLPFKDNEFDVITSAFLMRNTDIDGAFSEQFRVLIPGGRVVCLDTTPTCKTLMSPLIDLYLSRVIPFLGSLIAGSRSAYTYLSETARAFKNADELKAIMIKSGFEKVSYRKYMFGTIAIHWGKKPIISI